MATRTAGPLAGIGWLKNAINLGHDNPKALFGAAGLIVLAALAVVVPLMLLQAFVLVKLAPSGIPALVVSLLPMLVLLALFPALTIGYLRMLDAVEAGGAARATDVFAGFRDRPVLLRGIGFMLLLVMLQYALMAVAMAVFAPDLLRSYADALQASPTPAVQPTALPAGFWLGFAVILVMSLFSHAVQAIGFGQIALRGRGVFGAIADGVAGTARNALPLLVAIVVTVVAALVLGLILTLLVMLLAFVAKLVGTWLVITLAVLAVPLYFGLMLAMYVVMFGFMYYLWRDVCGGSDELEGPAEALAA